MQIKLSILGLGQIGASIGLALARSKDVVYRVGFDQESRIGRQAASINAVDKVYSRLSQAVEDADVILMTLPADQIRPMLEKVAPMMKTGAVLMDTALCKVETARQAAALLPEDRWYVGLTPVINPAYLPEREAGIKHAQDDLFQRGMIAVSTPPDTDPKAVKLAADLTRLLGAEVLFIDMLEVDSIMTATHLLPQLLAAALLNATTGQPNWSEAGQMAGQAYAEATAPITVQGGPLALSANAVQNQEHALRFLDSLSAALDYLRADIAAGDEDILYDRLERAFLGRENWLKNRQSQDLGRPQSEPIEKPSIASTLFGSLLRTGGRKPKDNQP